MKDIVSLRNNLFDQLTRLAETPKEEIELEISRASSIVQVAEAVIKTAEVENAFISITKSLGSGFVPVVNNGNPKSLLKQIEEAALNHKTSEQASQVFNVDKESNWLT